MDNLTEKTCPDCDVSFMEHPDYFGKCDKCKAASSTDFYDLDPVEEPEQCDEWPDGSTDGSWRKSA